MKILDLTSLFAGPYCTLLLAQLGAEVIKIEPVGKGDPARYIMPEYFAFLNYNKKSITLDIKSQKGKTIFLNLAKNCNVLLENFRPGVVKNLYISYEEIKKINPEIIYCSISGYGQTGPYSQLPGHDINYQSVGGLIGMNCCVGSPSSGVSGIQMANICGATFALSAILSAYCYYLKQGQGQYIDVSMTDGLLSWLGPRLWEWNARGRTDKKVNLTGGSYGIFETKDGKYLSLGIVEKHFWENFCSLVGREDLLKEKYGTLKDRRKYSNEVEPEIEKIIKKKDLAEWMKLFIENNIPGAPVNYLSDLDADPHLQFRELFKETDSGEFSVTPFPVKFSEYKFSSPISSPALGEHKKDLLKEFNYTEKEIQELESQNII